MSRGHRRALRAAAVALVVTVTVVGACGPRSEQAGRPEPPAETTGSPGTAPSDQSEPDDVVSGVDPAVGAGVVEVSYRVEVRSEDPALADFPAVVAAVLDDERGWRRAAFGFRLDPAAEFRVAIAEPDDAQQLCLPYDVYRTYSCQNGADVVINADRWRHATPQWTGDLATYRVMLVNHEVGHLLGMRHPEVQCPERGRPAAIMAQQSTELRGCLPNPWPLDHEIHRAARHDLPLAPPYDR